MPASQAGEHFVALVNCAGGIDADSGIDIDHVLATDLDNGQRGFRDNTRMEDGEHRR
ncbi:hypothetical protein CM1200mP19_2880 [bacterium]|nr:MAG: hypothetical protein CM1200mP19_2880 [bacterium]